MAVKFFSQFVVCFLIAVFTLPVRADETAFESKCETKLDFTNDIIPILTKSGCNAGACHGAAVGRGGFKLSLYGGDPTSDYDAIVRQVHGRRVNLADADASLLILKPTESLEHGGGLRFDIDSPSATRLREWIEQGVTKNSARKLARVEVDPNSVQTKLDEPTQLRTTAFYSDGSSQDVTRWTIFKAEDPSAISISEAVAQVKRRGRHIVIARYLDHVIPVELIVPLNKNKVNLTQEPRLNFIDEAILAKLSALRLPVSPLADNTSFARRVTLDLTGRLPTEIPNPKTDRRKLIDDLLASEEFTEYWTWQLAKLLRIRTKVRSSAGTDTVGIQTYHAWLKKNVKADMGYDQFARTLLLADGDSHTFGPANFYRTVRGARQQAEFVSELFMGSRLRCANCHNHPLDRWTQDDYHGLAAIFAKVESGNVIKVKSRGEVIHPRTGEAANSRIPGEQFLDVDSEDARRELADWLTAEDNPYFAKAIVNRLWKAMMGRGLVEPADDFRATNPATHPALLNQLADDFKAHKYSLRHTLRQIANSSTYQRTWKPTAENRNDDQFYSHALRRPLPPEVLADAISDVLDASEKYGTNPDGFRAVALVDAKTPSKSLDVLGRCDRDTSCEGTAAVTGGLPQKLHLFNGALLNNRLAAKGSRLSVLLENGKSPGEIVTTFYQVALQRDPSVEELQFWQDAIASNDNSDQKAVLEDFVWSLLNFSEFTTNH